MNSERAQPGNGSGSAGAVRSRRQSLRGEQRPCVGCPRVLKGILSCLEPQEDGTGGNWPQHRVGQLQEGQDDDPRHRVRFWG